MQKVILKHKPEKVYVDIKDNVGIFVIQGKNNRIDLKDELTKKNFRKTVEDLSQFVARIDTDKYFGYELDWTIEDKQPEELPDDLSEIDKIFHRIDKLIVGEELLEIVLTSTGTLVKDSKVVKSTFDINTTKIVYDEFAQEEANAIGMIPKELTINGNEYNMLLWKIGDETSVKFSRRVTTFEGLTIQMPTDMKHRLDRLNHGLIVTSFNRLTKMEHMVTMMESVDPNFTEVACSVGDNLIKTELPTQDTTQHLDKLKHTHYSYIIITKINTKEELLQLMELIYAGKTIIIGFDNDSVYANLISILSLCGGDDFMINKVLMSTVGFVHPVLRMKESKLSLEDTECVTLSSVKANGIINGDLSKEKFNLLIERPSKVYNLSSGDSKFVTQEEELNGLLKHAVELGASDIHLAVGTSPKFRVQGQLKAIDDSIRLKPEAMEHIVSLLVSTEQQKATLEETNDLYLNYSSSGIGRFRVQISVQRGTYSIVIRHTKTKIPSVKETRIPQVVVDAVKNNPKGLVIVTGGTNSGKSTTSAVLIDVLKESGSYAITSLADPIEFLHSHGKGIVTQREIPSDVMDFDTGLLSAFRSDPDIIEIGEMRTKESIQAAMRFANSGHLAITTYHTSTVKSTFDALMNRVDSDRKTELLHTLSQNIIVIINQKLVEGTNGKLVPIFEYLIPNRTIRKFIADNNMNAIESEMKTSALSDKSVASWSDYELVRASDRGEISKEIEYKNLISKDARKDLDRLNLQ